MTARAPEEMVAWNNGKCATQYKCLEMVNQYESTFAAANGCGQPRAGTGHYLCLAAVGGRGAASLHKDRS